MRKLLVIVYDASNEGAYLLEMLADEQATIEEMDKLGIQLAPGGKERHLFFELLKDLTSEQEQGLRRLKDEWLITDFYVEDEERNSLA